MYEVALGVLPWWNFVARPVNRIHCGDYFRIIGFPKDGPDPSKYFKGKDSDKRLVARMKKKYGLQHYGWVYRVHSINDLVVCITARILASNIVRMN